MKLNAVIICGCFLLAGPASAQIVIVPGQIISPPYGGYWYFGPRPRPSPVPIGSAPIMPLPRVTINNFFGSQGPILGPGYSEDTRGVDLDKAPLKKPAPREKTEPAPPVLEKSKPLPGVEVSKSRPSVRPDGVPEPAVEKSDLISMGLVAFQAGEYGLATQRFRQATEAEPKNSRAWFLLSQAEFAVGGYREATAAIFEGMKIDKQWPRMPVRPRIDLYKGREAEFAEQMKRLTDSVAANPNHPTLLYLAAHQLWFDDRRGDALALFQRVRPLAKDQAAVDAFLSAGGPGGVATR